MDAIITTQQSARRIKSQAEAQAIADDMWASGSSVQRPTIEQTYWGWTVHTSTIDRYEARADRTYGNRRAWSDRETGAQQTAYYDGAGRGCINLGGDDIWGDAELGADGSLTIIDVDGVVYLIADYA